MQIRPGWLFARSQKTQGRLQKNSSPFLEKKTQGYGGNCRYQKTNSIFFDKNLQNSFKSSMKIHSFWETKKMSTLLWNFPTKQRNFPGSDPYSFNQNRNFYLKLPLQPITQIASCQCFSTILSFIHFMSNLTILTIKVNWKKFNLASFKLSLRCLRGCAQFFLSIDSIESQFWRNRLCIFFWLDVWHEIQSWLDPREPASSFSKFRDVCQHNTIG